jgi:DNA modification methylase
VVARRMSRNSIGIEIMNEYYEIARGIIERMEHEEKKNMIIGSTINYADTRFE